MPSRTSSRALFQHLLVLSACVAAAYAHAETSPYYIGGSVGATHVSNVYRTTQGQPTNNDTVTYATLLAGFDQRLGRQRVFADTSVSSNTYKTNTNLNNTSNSVNGGLDWQALERWSGSIKLATNSSLAQFNPGDAPSLTIKNTEKFNSAAASVRYGLMSLISLDGSVSHSERTYSASEFAANEIKQTPASLGLTYHPSSQLSLGLAARHTAGKYPKYLLTSTGRAAETFSRNDIDLTSTWVASGASTIKGRLSTSKTQYDTVSARDYTGVTGAISWTWVPSSKLKLNSTISRDTGVENSFISLGSLGNLNSDNSRITNLLQTRADYALTGKIGLNVGVSLAKRDLSNSVGGKSVSGDDKTTIWNLGSTWALTRSSQLGCQLTRNERTGQSTLSQPYTYSSYGCYAQLTLQ